MARDRALSSRSTSVSGQDTSSLIFPKRRPLRIAWCIRASRRVECLSGSCHRCTSSIATSMSWLRAAALSAGGLHVPKLNELLHDVTRASESYPKSSGSEFDAPLTLTHSAQEGAHSHARESCYARFGVYAHEEARSPTVVE